MIKGKMAIAQYVGRSHVRNNQPCQDRTYALNKNGVKVITLADGAGSCSMSHYGAEVVCKRSAEYMAENFDAIYNESDRNTVVSNLIDYLLNSLESVSIVLNCNLKDLSSTLLISAVKGDKYMLFSLGDGIIGYRKNDEMLVATKPMNGQYSNQTYFVTCSCAKDMVQAIRGTLDGIEGFILMSDGSANSLYDKRNEKLNQGLLKSIDTVKYAEETFEKFCDDLEYTLEKVIIPRTYDDCSLAIMA